ncbi:EXSHypothetical protein, partial [Rhizoctonia solani]
FKKNLNRAGTTLMQKTGQIERTVDREFADEEAKYKAFEKETNALQKESKAYLDAMRAMTAAQTRLAETIDTFYAAADKASEGAMAGHAYKRSVDELDAGVTRELDAPYRTTVFEPVGKMCSYFPIINDGIAKRNKKMLDYDASRSKVRKLVDKPSEDATKLPRAQAELDEAKEIFDMLNEQLIAELPQLLDLRVPYFDPSFEAMIRMQCKFAEEGYEKLGGVQRYFAENVRDDYAAGQLDAQAYECHLPIGGALIVEHTEPESGDPLASSARYNPILPTMAHHPPGYHESTSPTRTVAREPPSYEPDPALPLPTTFKVGKSYTPPLISVSSVRNHLSVLECFATLKRNVENAQPILTSEPLELDPEIKWAIYLVRANHRFGRWIDNVVNRIERQRGEVVELTNEEIPPIDVLLLWHAYLLNPVGYYEDCESRYPCLRLIGGFPLDRVASRMNRYEGRVHYMPRDSQIDEWELLSQEPFELPLWTTVSDTVSLTCPMCASPDIRIPWITEPTLEDIGDETAVGKGYAQSRFRIDCQACGGAVTKDKLRAERFVKEFVRVRREIRRGNEPSPSLGSNFTKLCVEGIHDLDENPQLTPHIALGSYFDWDLNEAQRLIEAGFKRKGSAALRQEKFTSQILSLAANFSVTDAITGYHSFLDLCAHNSSKALVPTLMIDLGWHTHMLSGEQYSKDCWRLFEKLVGHEDKVEEGKLGIFSPLFSFKVTKMSDTAASFDETARLWKSRFGGHYSTCGCISVQQKSSSSLKFWKKSPSSSVAKPETHPTEHNSIVAVNPKKGVSENRRSRAGPVSALKHGISSSAEHVQAFIGDYANADGRPFSSVGLRGWDIDCIRQPFVVNSDDDRGDCCVVRFLISVCLLGIDLRCFYLCLTTGCANIVLYHLSHVRNWGRGGRNPSRL